MIGNVCTIKCCIYHKTILWTKDGVLHREDGPAIIISKLTKHWYINGKRHREDGPAIITSYGTDHWYIDDHRLTEDEFKQWYREKRLKQLLR